MSATVTVTLMCDTEKCPNALWDLEVPTPGDARRVAAHKHGWSRKGRTDLCDVCTKAED